jgi:hypothetical protein
VARRTVAIVIVICVAAGFVAWLGNRGDDSTWTTFEQVALDGCEPREIGVALLDNRHSPYMTLDRQVGFVNEVTDECGQSAVTGGFRSAGIIP